MLTLKVSDARERESSKHFRKRRHADLEREKGFREFVET